MEKIKPNIIIVMTDQQRADLRKSAGYSVDTMPFLDEWAKGGIDFENAYTSNPACMPARVSMFTGRYPEAHRVRTNHNKMDAIYTQDLIDILKEQGYKMGLCGKNHSHRDLDVFDYYNTNGHLHMENAQTKQQQRFNQFLKEIKCSNLQGPSPGGVEVQFPYRNVSAAFQFIDNCTQNNPFFLWLSFAEPHNPYQVPEPYYDLFPPASLPKIKTTSSDLEHKGKKYKWIREVWEQILGEELEEKIDRARSNYHGMLRLIDDQFKRLIQGLEERNLKENTLVIFLSDHGDFVGEYGLMRKGVELPEVLIRIPIIWRGPGIKRQGRVGTVCTNIVDILPTICDVLDVQQPFGCQGKSIKPLLEEDHTYDEEYITAYAESGYGGMYWTEEDDLSLSDEGASKNMETLDCLNTWTQCGQIRMLRKGHYKIQVDMMGEGYLYNIKADPYEVNNLWSDEMFSHIKLHLLTELCATILKNCDNLPAPHTRYRVKQHPKGYWNQEYVCKDPGVKQLPPLGFRNS